MTKLTMRRITYTAADAGDQLQQLCRQLSLQADVVSPRGRALTEEVFGEALTPGSGRRAHLQRRSHSAAARRCCTTPSSSTRYA